MRPSFLAVGCQLIAVGLALAGCNAIPGYAQYKMAAEGVVDDAIKERMDWNDKKAELVQALNCDISLGAYGRMPAGNIKQGVALICGLDTGLDPTIASFIVASAMMNAASNGTPLSEVVTQMQKLTQPPAALEEPAPAP